MPTPTNRLVQATSSFVARVGGIDVTVRVGDVADADSAIVKQYPALFSAVSVRFPAEPRVEQATAGPGEKRGR